MRAARYLILSFILCLPLWSNSQSLQVKKKKTAIIKDAPTGNAQEIMRIPANTKVKLLGKVPRYYKVQLDDCQTGYSYKGNFKKLREEFPPCTSASVVDSATLIGRTDVLKMIVLDVEKGDATLVICPEENGIQDILLIDAGEKNDGQRIIDQLLSLDISLSNRPIKRFYASHYDGDHIGGITQITPYIEMAYDHGENKEVEDYVNAIKMDSVIRMTMQLDYHETFTGGVEVECVAVNNATDVDPSRSPSEKENDNSIALIISYNGFDYFTGGDLTSSPEKSLAADIRNIDVYHVNHHGSSATSSKKIFVTAIDPEVSVVSNGTQYGHPTAKVANRLINLGSTFYQTNRNTDTRSYLGDPKYVADDTYFDINEEEDAEGAIGNISIIVDAISDKYYIFLKDFPFHESAYSIEH